MKIYKDDGKIVVEFMRTDVVFNNSEKAESLIYIDGSVMNDVKLILPEPNENVGIIAGLNDEQYRELSELIMKYLKKVMQENQDQPFVVTNKSINSF